MPSRAKPVRRSAEARNRARRIFARLIGGQSIRSIAEAEKLSVRRVQQIVRHELDSRDAIPADDFALLQIARLERALDILGGQIEAGKPAAVHAFVRVLDQLNRLAPGGLRAPALTAGTLDAPDMIAERLGRLDAARESLMMRDAEGKARTRVEEAQRREAQALENRASGEMGHFAPSTISVV